MFSTIKGTQSCRPTNTSGPSLFESPNYFTSRLPQELLNFKLNAIKYVSITVMLLSNRAFDNENIEAMHSGG